MRIVLSHELYCRLEDDLNHAWMTYTISADLVDTVLKFSSTRKFICLSSFEVFAVALSSYDNMLQKRGFSEKIKTQHKNGDHPLQLFQKRREFIMKWLKELPFLTKTKEYLKV